MKTLLLALASSVLLAQSPSVVSGRIETRPSSGDLASQLRGVPPAWFGYRIKTAPHTRQHCADGWNQPVQLEGSDSAMLLYRVADNQVQKLELYSLACTLDTGGLTLVWLTGVSSHESLAFLESQLSGPLANQAIFAISQHTDPAALEYLIQTAKNNPSTHLREQALFWLSQKAGLRAAAAITGAILNDPDTGVKKHAVFALSQLPKDEAVPKLIEIARTQRNPEVRKQAFFWLGQSHDPRALAYIEDVLLK